MRGIRTVVLAAALAAGVPAAVVTLQTGLNGYAGVTDMELRDPRQGTIGATWHSWIYELAIQEN